MNEPQDNGDARTDDAPLVAEPESFGTWLRRQREVREIDLREIADSSKVSMSYLRAFEEDRFEVLPAPLFAKGFLRQYARYVGLDPEEVVNFYLAARQPENEEPSLQPHASVEPPARNYLFFVLSVTAALVLLVWLLSVFNDRAPASSRKVPDANAATPASAASTRPVSESPQRAVDRVPAPVTVAKSPLAAEPTAAIGESSLEPEPEPSETEDTGPPLRVTLDFLSDCWVEASVDGAEKLSELKVQGESLILGAEDVVEFKVGDVSAVQVEVNGIPYQIEDRRGTSVRNVRIDLQTATRVAAGSTASPDDDRRSQVDPEGGQANPSGEGR